MSFHDTIVKGTIACALCILSYCIRTITSILPRQSLKSSMQGLRNADVCRLPSCEQNRRRASCSRLTKHSQAPTTTATATATLQRQAVRSLGPLGCACYQACTCGLSTSWSGWDLDSREESGKTDLGCGFALRCFQRLSLLDIAIQLWPRQANWRTSGPAISVLSYWR